jgi:segregation and condensation protein B
MPAPPDHDAAELDDTTIAAGPTAPAEDANPDGVAPRNVNAGADAAPASVGDPVVAEAADPCGAAPRAADADADAAPTVADGPMPTGATEPVGALPRAADAGGDAAPAVADGRSPAGAASPAGEPASDAPTAAAPDDAGGADASAAELDGGAESEAPPDPALFAHALRIAEALVFASDRPVTPARLQAALPPGCDARAVLTALSAACAGRPVQLAEVAGGFAFRTAPELAPAITRVVEAPRRLPRAAMETLAIVAYHQPVTRAEIEEIRGASLSQSTLEMLLDASLIAPRGRKEVPGRPSLWGTTPRFLEQFGLKALHDLPRREELVNEPPALPLSAPPEAPPSPPEPDAAPPSAAA